MPSPLPDLGSINVAADVGRVVEILSELEAGHGFEVVPVERFMALANAEHTYRTRFGPSGDRDDTEL